MSQTLSIDELASNYEDDFRYLIYRISSGEYGSLLNSFYILSDLFCLIKRLEKLERCRVNVPPPTEISNPAVLSRLRVDPAEKRSLRDFLSYIERSKGKKFEELIADHMSATGSDETISNATAANR